MNVCAKCGTRMADGVMSCPACGGLPVRVAAKAGGWRHLPSGAIALVGTALIVLGLIAAAAALAANFGGDYTGGAGPLFGFPPALGLAGFFLLVSVPLTGTARGVLAGMGFGLAGASGATFAVGYVMYKTPGDCPRDDSYEAARAVTCFVDTLSFAEVSLITLAAVAAFALFFYVGYRLAR